MGCDGILGLDYETGNIFYSAASNGPLNKIIYKLNLNTGAADRLTDESGWSEAEFTNGFKYFVHSYSTANSPTTHVLKNSKGEIVAELETNQELKEKITAYKLSPKEFIKIDANGVELNASIIKPHNFDPSKNIQYMLLFMEVQEVMR